MGEKMPDLSAVISWLENGCDPKDAAKELRIYKARIDALPAVDGKPVAEIHIQKTGSASTMEFRDRSWWHKLAPGEHRLYTEQPAQDTLQVQIGGYEDRSFAASKEALMAVQLGNETVSGAVLARETQGLLRDPLQRYIKMETVFAALSKLAEGERSSSEKETS